MAYFPRWPEHYGSGEQFTRFWLLKPDRSLATILDRFLDFEMELLPFENGNIRCLLPLESRWSEQEWEGVNVLERDLENWGCWFYYRDPGDGSRRVFNGIANTVATKHRGRRGSATVEVEFSAAFWELMRRRQVWTDNGRRWEFEDTPDNIVRQMIGECFEVGKVVTPNECNDDRTRLGPGAAPWSLAVENVKVPGDHPETLKYVVDHGTHLPDCLRELFEGRMPTSNLPTDIYPRLTEGNNGNFQVDILFGKELVDPEDRQIGRDFAVRQDVVIAPERSNMVGYDRNVDRFPQLTLLEIRGRLGAEGQYRQFVSDPEMFARVGDMEDSYTIPNGDTFDEVMFEARTILNKRKGGIATTDVEIVERDRLFFPEWVNVMDTVILYSGSDTFDLQQTTDVVRVKLSIPIPGHPQVQIGLGQLERQPISEMGRHGGGRGSGGSSGGRPRQKGGTEGGCPDTVTEYLDEHAEVVTIEGLGCGRKMQILGDVFLTSRVRGPEAGDPGPGDQDVVYFLEWCAPACDNPIVAWPEAPHVWWQVCIKDPLTGETRGMFAVPAWDVCQDAQPPVVFAIPPPPPGP